MIEAAAKMMASRFFAALEAEVRVDSDTNTPEAS
jgi:hypothetical protein